MTVLSKSLPKVLPRSLATVLVLVLMVLPVGALDDGMALPVEKKISVGISVIEYAGEQLEFTTPVTLLLNLEPISEIEFSVTVSVYPGMIARRGSPYVTIVWKNRGGQVVYYGPPPQARAPFEGVFNSESGFTEK